MKETNIETKINKSGHYRPGSSGRVPEGDRATNLMSVTNGTWGSSPKQAPWHPRSTRRATPHERRLVGSGGSPASSSNPSPISRLGNTGGRVGEHRGPDRCRRYESVVMIYRKCTEQTRTRLATRQGPVANPRQVTMAALAQVVDGGCRRGHSPPCPGLRALWG